MIRSGKIEISILDLLKRYLPLAIGGIVFPFVVIMGAIISISSNKDEMICQMLTNAHSLNGWKFYLINHPEGPCRDLASKEIERLQQIVDGRVKETEVKEEARVKAELESLKFMYEKDLMALSDELLEYIAENHPEDSEGFKDSNRLWQKYPFPVKKTSEEADKFCNHHTIKGSNTWRVPSIGDLRSMVQGCDATKLDGECRISNFCNSSFCSSTACTECDCAHENAIDDIDCLWEKNYLGRCRSNTKIHSNAYWSSTQVEDKEGYYWTLNFKTGRIEPLHKDEYAYVRCISGF